MHFSRLAKLLPLLVHLREIYEISEIWLEMEYFGGN